MPIAGNGHSAVLNNKFFVIGCGSPANRVQAYDPGSNTWDANYSTLPVARNDDGAVAADQASGKIYDAGGYSGQSLDRLDILSLGTLPPVITSPLNLDFLSTNEVFDPPQQVHGRQRLACRLRARALVLHRPLADKMGPGLPGR